MKRILLLSLSLCLYLVGHATVSSVSKKNFYIYWGWNGSNYTTSNLSLKGSDYDFKIHNMKAKDRQSPLSWDYINPGLMTIPQYNFRIGYFIKENWSISIGMDHMKYVMVQNQNVLLSGNINHPSSIYKGNLDENFAVLPLSTDFLTFEHTDGLNNLNVETRYHYPLYHIGIGKKDRGIDFQVLGGAGLGAMIPKTNAQLFSQQRHDDFHLSGFDVHAVVGLKIDFWKYFFISSEFKGGYINMPSIRITHDKSDIGSQAFGYIQYNILFGGQFRLF